MSTRTHKQALKRYKTAFVITMALYLIGLLGSTWLLAAMENPPLWASLAGMAAATLPLLAFIYVWLRFISEADEYHRMRQLWAFAVAGGVTLAAIFTIGFLQIFDVFPPIEIFWFGPTFIAIQGLVVRFGRWEKS